MTMTNSKTKTRSVRTLFLGGVRLTGRLILTVIIVVGAGLVVQFGASELGQRAAAAPAPAPASVLTVSTRTIVQEEGYEVTRAFVGQVEPQKTTSISFELAGQLKEIRVEEGDWVSAGQTLATLDTSLLEAETDQLTASRTALEAQLQFARQTVERNQSLSQQGFTSEARLDEAIARRNELTARIAEIDAGLRSVAIRIEKSRIGAPFDGRVTERMVDGRETLSPGQRVLDLVELQNPQVRIGVPIELTETALRNATIEINGSTYQATLLTLRPDVDPVTRTRTAVFEVRSDNRPAFGQTARLLTTEWVPAQGTWLPLTSLKEGVRGQWTVLVVDSTETVRSATVEVLHAESDRVFVRGAFPAGISLIDKGPQRVTVGQQVATAEAF